MRVLADEGIPGAHAAFAALGTTTLVAGRGLTPEHVRACDVLFVRSVTRVDAELLRGSPVRFVGTASVGTDHVDIAYLRDAGIGFADAAGSNANSVAEYVVCALLCLARRRRLPLAGRSLGVVGVGNVGRRVARHAAALGMDVLLNDPPRARAEVAAGFRDLEDLLGADFITIHVPLVRDGPDATRHLFDARRLRSASPTTVLINSARGAVVDNLALREALRGGAISGAVLDVWEGEPRPDPELIQAVELATPHIAGYSLDGKLAGTECVARAACRHFGIESDWRAVAALPQASTKLVLAADLAPAEAVRLAARACYDIEKDDAGMRALASLAAPERAAAFDRLRREYPVRREFAAVSIEAEDADVRRTLRELGFRVDTSASLTPIGTRPHAEN